MKIHPNDFFKQVEYLDTLLPCVITEQVNDELRNVHPSQIIMMPQTMILYRVKISYRTLRGRERESSKYVFFPDDNHEPMEVDMKVLCHIEDENKSMPYRAISNVKILEVESMAKTSLSIE